MFPNEAVTIEKSLYFKNRIFAKNHRTPICVLPKA